MLADDLTLPLLLHLPPASQLTFQAAVGAPVDAAAAATATVTARLIIDATLSGSEIRGSVNLPGALLRVPSRSTSQFVPEIQRWCKRYLKIGLYFAHLLSAAAAYLLARHRPASLTQASLLHLRTLPHGSIAVAATALSAALEGATSITAAFISH